MGLGFDSARFGFAFCCYLGYIVALLPGLCFGILLFVIVVYCSILRFGFCVFRLILVYVCVNTAGFCLFVIVVSYGL